MPRLNAGDDSNPHSGEGGPRKTPAQYASDPAFTSTLAPLKAWCSLPSGWDAGWKAAKAALGSAPATILAHGASITQGYQSVASSPLTNGWFGQLRSTLLGGSGTPYGDFYPVWPYNGSFGYGSGLPFSAFTGSNTPRMIGYGWGVGMQTACQITFTTPYACTGFDVVYMDYAAGTVPVTVDGSGASGSPITCANGGGVPTAAIKKFQVRGLANTTHTIVIGAPSVYPTFYLLGVSTFSGNAGGYGFVRNGYSGIRAVDFGTPAGTNTSNDGAASFPDDKIVVWQGMTPQSGSYRAGGDARNTGFGFPTQPAVVFMEMILNDHSFGISPKASVNIYRRYIQAFRRGYPNASVVGFTTPWMDPSSAASGAGTPVDNYFEHKRVFANLMASYSCAFVDFDAKWSETGWASGLITDNDPHPTTAGYADMAATFAGIL